MKSLLSRLTLALCVAALVLLVAGGFIVYFTAQRLLEADFDAVLTAKADALLTTAEVDGGRLKTDFEVQAFAGFGSAAGGDYFEFRTPDGRLLARSPSLKRDRLPAPVVVPTRRPQGSYIMLPHGREGRAVWQASPLETEDGAPDMMVELGVASDSSALRQTLRTLAWVVIGTSGLGLLAALVLLRHVLRLSLRPVDRMARDVHDINVEDLDDVLSTDGLPAELTPVGHKLNELLARARKAMERERSFSSHAAHELRTPLAELRAMTELMGLWTDEVTPARCEEMQAVIGRLESLLQKLALLSRADAGQQPVRLERVNVESVLQEALQRFSEAARGKGLKLSTTVSGGELFTDVVLWEAVINNVLENAVTYAPSGSEVKIEASPDRFCVINAAPHLTPADVERVEDRFWRKDGGDPSASQSHSGLGLALVSTYARLLGWNCELRLDADQKFIVTLRRRSE